MTRKRKHAAISTVDNNPNSSIESKLTYAQIKAIIKSGDGVKLKELIESGLIVFDMVNQRKSRDLLIDACEKGLLECVKTLLEYNTGSNRAFKEDIVRSACRSGSTDLLRFLIEKGMVISDDFLLSVIIFARDLLKSTEISVFLIESFKDINYRYGDLDVLCSVSEAGNADVVSVLLQRGASRIDRALSGAAYYGRIKVVELLLTCDIQLGRISMEFMCQALRWATGQGHIDVVRCIVEYGVDINAMNDAFRASVSSNKVDIAEYLLDSGADINSAPANAHSNLYLACAQGSSDMVQLLLACGADPNAVDGRGERPLMAALPCPDVVQLMLQAGADPNRQFRDGRTALLDVAITRHDTARSVLTALLQHGADPNLAHVGTGQTALMAAAVAERVDLVKPLLEYAADVTQLNNAGQSVLDLLSKAWNHRSVVKLCKQYSDRNAPGAMHVPILK